MILLMLIFIIHKMNIGKTCYSTVVSYHCYALLANYLALLFMVGSILDIAMQANRLLSKFNNNNLHV